MYFFTTLAKYMINFFTALFTIISLNTVENLNNFEGVDSKTASNL